MRQFVGRQRELKRLAPYKRRSNAASLIVLRGRRRIGKSRLIAEFAKNMTFLKFSGLPPSEKPTAQMQRTHFADTLVRLGLSRPSDDDWYNLFLHLAQNLPSKPTVLLLDEISWMAKDDPSFLPKLKDVWDDHFKAHPNLVFVLCGSVSSWIDKNILSNTGFYGRINETVTLKELSLSESLALLKTQGFQGSALEKMLVLSVTGGVPWYLEQFTRGNTAEGHVRRLCFSEDGLFVSEFDRIFNDLFSHRAAIYKKIVLQLANGSKEYKTISEMAGYESSGTLSEYLNDLEVAGFITKDKTWSLKTGLTKKIVVYRLSDNYLRFYLKCIQPHLNKIERGHFDDVAITSIKGFATLQGLQFENIVLNNRALIIEALGVNRQNILADNPYFQRGGKTQTGCQIDYMIQTECNTLFVCEMKYSNNTIGTKVIKEIQEKCNALKKPKNLACLPVLITFGTLADAVLESAVFYKIIDFKSFFEG
mgnify:CR=1 FL=1